MKVEIDTGSNTVTIMEDDSLSQKLPLYSKKAFELLSRLWLKVGWNEKYPYTFTWMGRPLIQLPEDVLRIQEVVYRIKPDLIIETGVAHGGSLILYASLCKAMGKGRIVGVDIEIRRHNRAAIEAHELSSYITLIEGNAIDQATVKQVQSQVKPNDTVLVILDSNHSKAHVAAELELYSSFVTPGSYIVATDGSMEFLDDVPRGGGPQWREDNPAVAAREFAAKNSNFIEEQPAWPFNESALDQNISHWPSAWLKRIK